MKRNIILIICLLLSGAIGAQQNLAKNITLNARNQRLADVLEIISNQGDFFFSYNSSIVKRDSVVTITVSNQSVKMVLDYLFKQQYEYRESGNYIIIRRKPITATVTIKAPTPAPEKYYAINGLVSDATNGTPLAEATIYEKTQLADAISAYDGSFAIRLKQKYQQAALTISKTDYTDTTIGVHAGMNTMLQVLLYPIEDNNVVISPDDYLLPDSIASAQQTDTSKLQKIPGDSSEADNRWLTQLFVSSKQKLQTWNVGGWIAERPFSFSLWPGLSSHGRLSGTIVNHFSVNIGGGYSGGLKGFEIGGLFNINRKDAGYLQAAGLFNLTGGKQSGVQLAGLANTVMRGTNGLQAAGIANHVQQQMNGVQLSGISNTVMQSTKGFQASGVANINKLTMKGVQLTGVANYNGKSVHGFQAAGVYNHNHDTAGGMQLAGVGNFTRRTMRGIQMAGVTNYATHNKGLQIGLINIADTSDGFAIGLFNVVIHGYHKLYLGTDETMPTNFALKTGNRKLYSILLGGINFSPDNKAYSFGYGVGTEIVSTKHFALSFDISSQYLYLGSWDYLNLLNRASLNLHARFSKHFAIYTGPSFNAYTSNQPAKIGDFSFTIPRSGYAAFDMDGRWRGWGGWHAGIALF